MVVENENGYVKSKTKILNKEMAEWLKAADCKSVEVSHRKFESCSL